MLVRRESYRVVQAERKHSFSWNAPLLSLGEHLGSRSPGSADCGSDSCALSVTNYCTNNRPDQGAAVDLDPSRHAFFLFWSRLSGTAPWRKRADRTARSLRRIRKRGLR